MSEGQTNLVDDLIDAEILSQDGDEMLLSESFRRQLSDRRERIDGLDESALEEYVLEHVENEAAARELLDAVGRDYDTLSEFLAIREFVPDVTYSTTIQIVTTVKQLRSERPSADGTPGPFLHVDGDDLPFFVATYPRCIVYIWRDDCEPCDAMKQTFEKLLTEPPENVALLSVYGPDHAALLQEEYDVVGGPTTLFTVDGTVDARLHGAHYESVVKSEVDYLLELS